MYQFYCVEVNEFLENAIYLFLGLIGIVGHWLCIDISMKLN